jgi:hypothetical protein
VALVLMETLVKLVNFQIFQLMNMENVNVMKGFIGPTLWKILIALNATLCVKLVKIIANVLLVLMSIQRLMMILFVNVKLGFSERNMIQVLFVKSALMDVESV